MGKSWQVDATEVGEAWVGFEGARMRNDSKVLLLYKAHVGIKGSLKV